MNRIKKVLEEKGMNQEWLADKLGKSFNTVNGYAENRNQPSLEVLCEMADLFDTNISNLLSENKKVREPLFDYKEEEIDFEKLSNNFYLTFNKIKRLIKGDNANLFIYFLFIKEFLKYLNIDKTNKKRITECFNFKGLDFDKDLEYLLNTFDLEIKELNISKIKKLLQSLKVYNICNNYRHISNDIIGVLTEKIITKKESGAYYTSSETTYYIIENTILPQIIKAWSKFNTGVYNFLNQFEINNGISFIEDKIKSNNLLLSFIDLEKRFNTKSQLTNIINNIKIIDISCGSGSFIFGTISFFKKINKLISENLNLNYSNIYGVDIDEEAIIIIKTRLILEKYFSYNKINKYQIENFQKENALKRRNISLFLNNNKTIDKHFDIVLGNPPYIELNKINYPLESFLTIKCNNLYAMFLEENLNILKEGGNMGMIVPISYISTNRMKPVRNLLNRNSKYEFCSSFADRPSCLFNGVHQKLNIILLEKDSYSRQKKLYTSSYIHWNKKEKKDLFNSIKYTINDFNTKNFYFKVGNNLEKKIIRKLIQGNIGLTDNISNNKNSNHKAWVNMRLCFWNKAFTSKQASSEYKVFPFKKKTDSILFSAFINSNIFFFFWEVISDVWHITNKDLSNVKLDFSKFNSYERNKITTKYLELEKHLECNKKYIGSKQTAYKYQHKKSKILIDELDTFFLDYFKFSKQELKYLKDYQLVYRMNDELTNYLNERGYECN